MENEFTENEIIKILDCLLKQRNMASFEFDNKKAENGRMERSLHFGIDQKEAEFTFNITLDSSLLINIEDPIKLNLKLFHDSKLFLDIDIHKYTLRLHIEGKKVYETLHFNLCADYCGKFYNKINEHFEQDQDCDCNLLELLKYEKN
jgi:hypothetical protein